MTISKATARELREYKGMGWSGYEYLAKVWLGETEVNAKAVDSMAKAAMAGGTRYVKAASKLAAVTGDAMEAISIMDWLQNGMRKWQ